MKKTIHYCWFGRKKLPDSAIRCISSWKKYFPDYTIKEWNEDNFNVYMTKYTSQAYEKGKYAFVSDYARFYILFHEGGVYFDTDVEVIKPFDDIVNRGAFMGCEVDGSDMERIEVAPGLGIASEPNNEIYKDILELYSNISFINEDGTINTKTVVYYTTNILLKHGLENITGIQTVKDITIYPKEYFCPYDYRNGITTKTDNTHSIHWNSMTWVSKNRVIVSRITRVLHRMFGNDCLRFIKNR